ncbi:hypothetical protein GBA63_04785 [Rubrobacter tropicus]|uniref:Uncharacterized protein n=1 Tax=Rubrobacter tropicus TaxID=2653851 RepID=A0A6G8Q6D9_9ACTN|nr:hypothetical protein [Rubrobacter tropicus]QIN82032.1 hypothetical protein GBA63_04785 [Rubrobacter tropicus]
MNAIPGKRSSAGLMRGGLGLLSLSALAVGFWALLLPRSFYEDFPFPGRAWVSTSGPYNGHLIADVGAMYLALGVLLAAAAVSLGRDLVKVSLAVWLVFAVPHLVYHVSTLHHFPLLLDRVGNVVSLVFVVLLPLALLFLDGYGRTTGTHTAGGALGR